MPRLHNASHGVPLQIIDLAQPIQRMLKTTAIANDVIREYNREGFMTVISFITIHLSLSLS
jgi:hypothetical protein